MSEQQILSELSVDNIRKHVRHIVETMPSRLAGSPNAARMAAYSAAQLQAAGVAARIETIPGLVSFPREAELTILAPEHKVLPANTFGHSVETLPEGVSGELVYVGSGHFADYEGKDVAGKITLSELSYSPGRHEKQRIAALMGSTAQIMRNWGHPENASLPVRLGEARVGQSHARDDQDRDADHSLHRHLAHRRRHICSISSPRGRFACGCAPMSRTAGATCR